KSSEFVTRNRPLESRGYHTSQGVSNHSHPPKMGSNLRFSNRNRCRRKTCVAQRDFQPKLLVTIRFRRFVHLQLGVGGPAGDLAKPQTRFFPSRLREILVACCPRRRIEYL